MTPTSWPFRPNILLKRQMLGVKAGSLDIRAMFTATSAFGGEHQPREIGNRVACSLISFYESKNDNRFSAMFGARHRKNRSANQVRQ